MTALGLAARWVHLVCGLGLLGLFSAELLAGRSERPTALRWTARIASLTRWLVVGVLASGVLTLGCQAVIVAGGSDAIRDPSMWLRLLTSSRFGTVWLVRHGLFLLLGVLILLRERERSRADAIAWRLEGWALGAVAMAAMAWAGHAAAVEPLGGIALLSDALHLVAAGTWLGALLPLALLLRAASTEAGADARPYAVLAIRRFSVLAAALMLVIITTGLWNAGAEAGTVPALIGTRYGGLLLVKIALLVAVLALAVANRRLLPALSGDGVTVGRPAMLRLSRFIAGELALALLILGVAAALSLTVPALHESPRWPLSFRLSSDAVAASPVIRARLFIGAQLAFLGLLAVIIGALIRNKRGLVIGAGALAVVAGLGIALPPLAVDAYPTTYRRPTVAYEAVSIGHGMALYTTRCAPCHGAGGKGDGPGGAGLAKLPADLTAPHTGQHTAGDLFWWITHGIRASGMPPFGETLSEDERWDLINFLRALAAADGARALTPLVARGRPRLGAPDFTFAVGPAPTRSLKEFRGRWMVLLVLFSLPESRSRLDQLALAYREIEFSGTEVVAVPMDADPAIIGRLGATPPILFPVATEGAAEITAAYGLFSRAPGPPAPRHAEFLIDRQGYLRARWIPGGGGRGWDDLGTLRAQIGVLDTERPSGPAPDEHVH